MKECIAMLLAGGQGSRLYALTQRLAKPAVPFGGKYRIIDFPLSNCVNSGIDTVGILTQYQPLVLNEYIGNGQPWDLDRLYGGVHVLPPYQKATGSDWYKGTANAIYQNINFIDRYEPNYVVILSGDHIYKMDYGKMLDFHKEKGADCTIAVMEVPWEEASRFGIMTADENGTITKFEEKPKEPKSNLASMGIYIFTWEKLRKFLTEDEADPNSENDFGKNIIPNMLNAGEKMVAYAFEGYWKDVGTIDSLWDANMDLLNPNVALDVWDDSWKIYSRTSGLPGHKIGSKAVIDNSMITEGCRVDGTVIQSVLFDNTRVAEGATVEASILMPGSVVEPGACVRYSIIAENVVVKRGAMVGVRPEDMDDITKWGVAVVGEGITVGAGAKIGPKAMVVKDVKEGEEQW
ncbi:glucose-1-phosphate adenylyltransferase [Gemmiger sp. An120]|uniref:glucose-1-phosphate adenylyltransferase n=1 Tax=Gemmiger sp. An120 TaxID=1965549 RepID=UPI000B3962DC|nr:glucose-1-phosphate adenylyltransferase [Gemmiger sp. An120]OUQ44403.1 glucose-1-phosphate adenylyltransferase [Gemmiger sp. An120]HIX33924.1 glucose-1-phosphate adenylyltransferase [Candidatus Gemmiger avium]